MSPSIPAKRRQYYPEYSAQPLGIWGRLENFWFYLRHRHLSDRQKILYALLPPPWISNAGDHAQVLAIQAWLDKHFPDRPRLELNQEQVIHFLPALRLLIAPGDIIFLHSGGNLGDRYMSTESARRKLIQAFPETRIVSLPQTVYFTETEHGAMQYAQTRDIYQAHPRLTILCRDLYSAHLSESLLPNITTFCIPDFVLSLQPRTHHRDKNAPILFCLRNDNDIESVFSSADKTQLLAQFTDRAKLIDIRREDRVSPQERLAFVETTLSEFEKSSVVVTDRFHGLIFAVLCQRPCVALPSIGHKMSFGVRWFHELPWVRWAEGLEEVPTLVKSLLDERDTPIPNWNKNYFDTLPAALGLTARSEWSLTTRLYPTTPMATNAPLSWQLHPQYQKPEEVTLDSPGALQFDGKTVSTDQWCYVYLNPSAHDWKNICWRMKVQKQTDFREFAFNFRYQDFDNRYRYRLEAGRAFFDRRVRGVWENNLSSVPYPIALGEWYEIQIQACGSEFRLEVNGKFLLRNFDCDLQNGSICLILWETDGQTNLKATVKDIEVFQIL